MRKFNIHIIIGIAITLLAWGCSNVKSDTSPRSSVLLDKEWRFHLGDLEDGEALEMDDNSWRILDLPHDWSIEDIPGTGSPLDSSAVGAINTGYFRGGTGWYRKQLEVPE
ncbi:MAG: glycoside hydrolase family 2, partial [Bacteroidia bacterium]